MCDNPSEAADLLTSKLSAILDQMAPIRTFQIRKKYVPWLSESTKELMKERDAAQATAASSRNQDDWMAYKPLCNTATEQSQDWTYSRLPLIDSFFITSRHQHLKQEAGVG